MAKNETYRFSDGEYHEVEIDIVYFEPCFHYFGESFDPEYIFNFDFTLTFHINDSKKYEYFYQSIIGLDTNNEKDPKKWDIYAYRLDGTDAEDDRGWLPEWITCEDMQDIAMQEVEEYFTERDGKLEDFDWNEK